MMHKLGVGLATVLVILGTWFATACGGELVARAKVTVTGAEGVELVNAKGEMCPCSGSGCAEIAGCAGGPALVISRQGDDAASLPRVEWVAMMKRADTLYIRTIGTDREITVDVGVHDGTSACEETADVEQGRKGVAYWWSVKVVRRSSAGECNVVLRQLDRAPKCAKHLRRVWTTASGEVVTRRRGWAGGGTCAAGHCVMRGVT